MNNVAVDIGVEKPTKEEVEEVLKELGKTIKKYILKINCIFIDENGDGKLSLDEFQVLIEQVLEMMANADGGKWETYQKHEY